MDEELISIIIPVYNVEQYLKKTVESVIGQTYFNWELLLINDGSTDSSGKICDEFSLIDKRIKVFHILNGGAAIARNVGIKNALGKYMCFIDSDDIVSADYVKFLFENLKKYQVDIMICGYLKTYNSEDRFTYDCNTAIQVWTTEYALEELLYRKRITSGPWCKLIKSDVVKQNMFPEGTLYEDQGCIYKWIAASSKIGYCSEVHYLYFMREKSCQHSEFEIKKMDHVKFAQEMVGFVNETHPRIKNAAINRLFTSAVIIFRAIPKRKYIDEYRMLKQIIKETRGIVLRDRKCKKSTRLLAFVSHISIDVLPLMGTFYDKFLLDKLKINIRY